MAYCRKNQQGNGCGRPRNKVFGRTKKSRNNGRDDGSVKSINRWQAGNRSKCYTLWQNDYSASYACNQVCFYCAAVYFRPPVEEGENFRKQI